MKWPSLCKVTFKICSYGCVGNLYFLGGGGGGGGLCTPSASHSAKYCFTKPFQAEVTQVWGGGGCTRRLSYLPKYTYRGPTRHNIIKFIENNEKA